MWKCAGPPGTNYAVMKKAFEEGWGGVIAKTISVDSSKVDNRDSCTPILPDTPSPHLLLSPDPLIKGSHTISKMPA